MKLKNPKTCNNCKANSYNESCTLGYKVSHFTEIKTICGRLEHFTYQVPQCKCPKPLTFKALIEIHENMTTYNPWDKDFEGGK